MVHFALFYVVLSTIKLTPEGGRRGDVASKCNGPEGFQEYAASEPRKLAIPASSNRITDGK